LRKGENMVHKFTKIEKDVINTVDNLIDEFHDNYPKSIGEAKTIVRTLKDIGIGFKRV
jgi:hypothetical protein